MSLPAAITTAGDPRVVDGHIGAIDKRTGKALEGRARVLRAGVRRA